MPIGSLWGPPILVVDGLRVLNPVRIDGASLPALVAKKFADPTDISVLVSRANPEPTVGSANRRCPDSIASRRLTKAAWGEDTLAHLPTSVPADYPRDAGLAAGIRRAFRECAFGIAPGRVVWVRWDVRPDGTISNAQVDDDAVDDKAFNACLAQSWWFPVTQKGGKMRRLFDFRTLE